MKKEDIEHLATLARIELRGGEAEDLATDITSIIGYVSDIETITADGDVTTKKVGARYNVMRDDDTPYEPGAYTEDILEAAPKRNGQYIEVKKILGGDSQ
ncbi:MAG: Asp-tRNA(Asn)/Glu-tRNA(Gln) amidotransferase subunit GatC [Candidatus Pacebacteria bacterium]|jgi:aspartyl-tRNA(Asn)/glutamyl-tRNA(Gln) amidotransferase subunit C|nr:Asp-tRNA(Asn)/Glu-tRNA(Gln) amidotransferase subunit GatC [Candidatus Paceibacterota bacterium]